MSTRISDIPDGAPGQSTDKVLITRGAVNRTLPFSALQTAKISATVPNNPIRAQYIADLVSLPYTGSAKAESTVTDDGANYGVVTGATRYMCAPYNSSPTNGDTLTIGTKTYTFVTSLTGTDQIALQGSPGNTMAALEFAINASQGIGNTGWYWVDAANPHVVAKGQAENLGGPTGDTRYTIKLTAVESGLGENIEIPMSYSGAGYLYFEWPGLYQQCYVVYDPNYNVDPGDWFRLPIYRNSSEQYNFVTTVTNPGDVLIGATGDDSMVNLTRAILNSGGISGTDYLPLEFGEHPLFELAQPFDPLDGYFFLQSKETTSAAFVSIDSSSYYCIWHQYNNGGIISGPYGNYGYSPTKGFDAGLPPPGGFIDGGAFTTLTFSNGVTTKTYTFVGLVTAPDQIRSGTDWLQALTSLKTALNADENSLGGYGDEYYLSEVSKISMVWQYGQQLITFSAKIAGESGNAWTAVWGDVLSPGVGPFAISEAFSGGGAQTTLTFSDGTRSAEYRFMSGTPSVNGDISVSNIGTDLGTLGLYLHYCIANLGIGFGNGHYFKSSQMCPLLSTNTGSYSSGKVSGLADVTGAAGNSYTVTPNDENIEVLRQFSGGAAGTEGYPGQLVLIVGDPNVYNRLYQMDEGGVWWYLQLSKEQEIWPVLNPTF